MQDFPKKYKSDYDTLALRQLMQSTKKVSSSFTTLLYTPYNISRASLGHSMYADVLGGIYAHQSVDEIVRHALFIHGNAGTSPVDAYKTYATHIHTLENFGVGHGSHIIGTSYSQGWRYFVRTSLARLAAGGFLQKKKVVSYRSIKAQTSLLAEEVVMMPRPTTVHTVRYFVDTKKESILVALDRPETLFADVALAVHPLDRRFKKLIGKKVIVPIINRIIPIVADEAVELGNPLGVYRVTPAHDFKSYAIAQRHGLTTDIYAFDHNNIFTEHAMIYAGKSVLEFRDNIVQYLYDIHNLQSSVDEVRHIAYSHTHKDYVYPFLTEQWVLSLDTVMQKIVDMIPTHISSPDLASQLQTLGAQSDTSIVSTQLTNDFILPIIQGYESIIGMTDNLLPYKKKKVAAFAALLLSFFHEGFLPHHFTLDQLVDLLFLSVSGNKLLMEEILNFLVFVGHVPKDNAQTFIADILAVYKNPKNIELCATILLTYMQDLDFVKILDNGSYQFVDKVLSLSGYTIDMSLFMHDDMKNIFGALAYLHAYPKLQKFLYVADTAHDAHFIYHLMGLALLLDIHVPAIQSLGYYENMYDTYLSKQQDSYDTYCADAYRYDVATGQQDLTKSYLIVSKIWNASRYVLAGKKHLLDWDVAHNKLTNITPFLSDFDLWIVQRFTDVFSKTYTQTSERLTATLQLIIDDFCIKYLEVSKHQHNEHTPIVLSRCILLVIHMLYPIMPFVVFHICQITGLSIIRDQIIDIHPLQTHKNYKIHLLMNIVSSLKSLKEHLGLKNHEQVDVFVKASADMITFIKTYQPLLDTIVRVHTINYTSNDYFDSTGYLTDTIIDIVVGLKQAAAYRTSLQQVQILLREKREYLTHLRALMTMAPSSDKADKIDLLKSEIEKLEVEEDKLF